MTRQGGADAASTYWRSVEQAAASTNEQKARRAAELLRLRKVAEGYRSKWFKEQPELTIDADDAMGGRVSANVSKLGGWGQGLSIKVKASRIDPFTWSPPIDETPAMAHVGKDRSLIFGLPLLRNAHGEKLRQLEAELIVLQQMLRAEQHRIVETKALGHGDANSDLKSWGGFGDWFANHASNLWMNWCEAEGYPFVPVRHSRSGYEEEHSCIAVFEDQTVDGILTKFRPSCSQWPMVCIRQARDPIAKGEPPADATEIAPDVWQRWKREQAALEAALTKRVGEETLLLGVSWPKGEVPQIDEVEGEPLVAIPLAKPSIPQNQKVTLNFDAADALQTVEAVFTRIDRERGLKLWPEFLQLATDHPQSPKASKVQTELAVDDQVALRTGRAMEAAWGKPTGSVMGRDKSTPIEAGDEPAPVIIEPDIEPSGLPTELAGFELLQAVRHKLHGQGVITHLFRSSFGKGNAGVDFNGTDKIVGLSELTPINAGELSLVPGSNATTDAGEAAPESTSPGPWPTTVEELSEPSQSQLRKQPYQADHDGLPPMPINERSTGKGKRVRLTNEQEAVVDKQIAIRVDRGLENAAIADQLQEWCGQKRPGLMTRIRNVRTRIEAGQEVAA